MMVVEYSFSNVAFKSYFNLCVHLYSVINFHSRVNWSCLLFQSQCKQSYDIKYSVSGTGLGVSQLAMYGRQILEALLYLQQCGMPPYGHLHSGNVIVENNTCR